MIDINEIVSSSIDENLDKLINEIKESPSNNDLESEVRVIRALMNFSTLLIQKYHEELKIELSKQGINI